MLLEAAQQLHDDLQSIAPRGRQVVNMLIGAGDELALAAADEVSAGTQVTKKVVTYGGKGKGTAVVLPPGAKLVATGLSPTEATAMLLADMKGSSVLPHKRACSLCREPGHWATNCPNAHKIQDAKKAEVAARPVKKPRAPMSPERKAQLIATLAKARAAKKGGKK